MKNAAIIALSICALVYIAYINNYLSGHFAPSLDYAAVKDYSHRYQSAAGKTYSPQYAHIIMIVLDGAKKEYVYSEKYAPNLWARWSKGGIRYDGAHAMVPTVSAPNYFSLLTGAPPYIHGVGSNARRFPRHQKIPTILHSLGDRDISARIIGFNWYKDMLEDVTEISPAECCEKDDSREVTGLALERLESGRLPFFTLMHYLAPDNAAHAGGSGISRNYRDAISCIDGQMERIFQSIDKTGSETLVILTSDHGMDRDGCHGGSDGASMDVPLYAFSKRLPSSAVGRTLVHASIAPTIAALAGVPLPPFAASGLLHELLDNDRRAEYMRESTAKREKLLEELTGSAVKDLTLGPGHSESLQRHDDDLTRSILAVPENRKEKLLIRQRIAAPVLFLLFVLWAVFRTAPGVPVILALNSVVVTAMGMTMGYIESGFRYNIAAALFIIVVFSLTLLVYRYALDASALLRLRTGEYTWNTLAALFAGTLILCALFVPFYSNTPDQYIYSFRFFMLAFYSPVIILSLLVFFSAAGARHYLISR